MSVWKTGETFSFYTSTPQSQTACRPRVRCRGAWLQHKTRLTAIVMTTVFHVYPQLKSLIAPSLRRRTGSYKKDYLNIRNNRLLVTVGSRRGQCSALWRSTHRC
ncbi:hypothetical protein F2P81_017975 [Scophthalmus maximus]|uniref:Uncharacterized protein n=1 Tax=Scophthalmus maximus TaxID=52904 RepID=A0A6A4SB17_SCOMX|nr:hypothetical protein F2P81_017975 [Scophthalmus maximus]